MSSEDKSSRTPRVYLSTSLPAETNYVGVFLTFACGLNCSYCINKSGGLKKRVSMGVLDWVGGLSRLVLRDDLPLTLQGGEPTTYPHLYELVNSLPQKTNIDLLTNGEFDIDLFMKKISPNRLKRKSKYASIRFSYHAEKMDASKLVSKVFAMKQAGYSVGIWGLDHPDHQDANRKMTDLSHAYGIDFRMKEFLGWHQGELYGTYKYSTAVENGSLKSCMCKSSEILIAPNGDIHRCHADLYNGRFALGNILDDLLPPFGQYHSCNQFGACNACDVKLKTNRFQEYGHASVEVRDLS